MPPKTYILPLSLPYSGVHILHLPPSPKPAPVQCVPIPPRRPAHTYEFTSKDMYYPPGPPPPYYAPSPPQFYAPPPLLPPPRRYSPWLVPLICLVNLGMFVYEMYENNCPSRRPKDQCILGTYIERFSFEPFDQVKWVGPAPET